MSLEEFKKEFYESRLDEWKNKYIKLKEMIHLINLIRKDIENHGGEIDNINVRMSTSTDYNLDDIKLDRRSYSLGILNDKQGIFDNNQKIFNSPIMFEIDKTFKEINSLQFEDDIKIFLYFLHIEVHNIYVFYLTIEKEIYTRTNSYLFQKNKNIENNNEEYVSNQLKELIEIAYLTYSFYLYTDLNVEAVKQILKYYDNNFIKINEGISIKKLFFNKNMLNKESDLKYILGFKIINECSILLENYCFEIKSNFQKNKLIQEQCKELQDVLSFIIEKNTIRTDDNIFEVYQKAGIKNNIFKKKENLNIDIQNSLIVDNTQNDLLEEEFEYDRQIKIKITNKNVINLILIYTHLFFYSFFGIIPYIVLFFLCKKNEKYDVTGEIKYYEIGISLSITHLGSLISKYFISGFELYKFPLIFFGICFFISFSLTIMSFIFIFKDFEKDSIKIQALFLIFNAVSRFIFGLSGGRVIIRKYINLFLPESKISFFSKLYMIIVYLGNISGIIFLFLILSLDLNFKIYIKINIITLPFIIGFFISLLYLLLIIIFFTEPDGDKGKMLIHQITINEKEKGIINERNENKKEDLELLFNENNKAININNIIDEDEDNNEEIPIEKFNSLVPGKKIKDFDVDVKEKDYKSLAAKTEEKKIRKKKLKNNKSQKYNQFKKKGSSSILNYISTSSENESYKKSFIKASEEMNEKLLTAEELKGLNSIEKAIININNENNFNDTNLFPLELDRIKQNQLKNNKTFFRTIIVFILFLNISNMINEFILLLVQVNIKIDGNYLINNMKLTKEDIENILFFVLIYQLIASIFSIIFAKSSFKNINRKLLIILNLHLLLSISSMFYALIKNINNFRLFFFIIVLSIFATNDLIIGLNSLFSDKIVPSFIKFCSFNVKYLISYISTLGKLLGGISFSIMLYLIQQNIFNNQKKTLIIFVIIYDALSLISFIVLCFNYNSLKMRALSKLRAIQV